MGCCKSKEQNLGVIKPSKVVSERKCFQVGLNVMEKDVSFMIGYVRKANKSYEGMRQIAQDPVDDIVQDLVADPVDDIVQENS